MSEKQEDAQNYSPWMNNWEQNFEKPKKETVNILQNKAFKIVLWVAFFGLLVSPVLVIVLGPILKINASPDSKSAGITKNDIQRLIGETEKFIMLNNYDNAIQRATFLISEDADIPKIYVLAGLANYHRMNYTQAIEHATEALKLNTGYEPAEDLIVMCQYKMNSDSEKASEIKAITSDYEYSYWFRVLYYDMVKDYDAMLTTASKGVQFHPNSLLMHYCHLLAQFRNNKFVELSEEIDRVLEKSMDNQISTSAIMMNIKILKAEVLVMLGKYPEAHEILNGYYISINTGWELIRVYSEYLFATEKYDVVIELLKMYGEPMKKEWSDYDVIAMYLYRGKANMQLNKLDDSLSAFLRVISIETGIADLNLDEIDLIEQYLTPVCHKALLNLALIEHLKGNNEKCAKIIKFINDVYLNSDETKEFEDLKSKLQN